jgi:hypothetical protein
LGLALSLTTGCSGAQHATAPPADPLFGVRTPPGMALPTDTPKTAGGAPTAPQAFAPGGVPAVPTSNQAANTATLAGNGWKGPLGQPTPLTDHHSGPPLLPGRGTIGTQTPQVPAPPPNANPKVEQVPDAPAPGAAVMPTASWDVKPSVAPASTPGQTTAAEILLKKLQDRGVVNQKQDLTPEGIHLTCYIPRETGGLRILEATAPDYAGAARLILQQLDAR